MEPECDIHMAKTTLCMNANPRFGEPIEAQIRWIAQAGFDGFFTVWDDHVRDWRRLADELGLFYQSVHAPITYVTPMWADGEDGRAGVRQLTACVQDCADHGIPVMVCHVYSGFEPSAGPTAVGLRNYGAVIAAAERAGIRIAFENTEGSEYLYAVLSEYREHPAVGFCWDAGHEHCYAPDTDFLARCGDRLIATHLNDNLGLGDPRGMLTSRDDLHMLPFDGTVDWQDVARRIVRTGYAGALTFELKRQNQPGRHTNDRYLNMAPADYFAAAHAAACRAATLVTQEYTAKCNMDTKR